MNMKKIYSKLLVVLLLLSFNQKCEYSKGDDKTHNVYMIAQSKPLALLCYAKEDLEKIMAEPGELGFLANEGKCFLEENSKKLKVIARFNSSRSSSNETKVYALVMQDSKRQAYIVSKQLVFTEIWQRVFMPKERFLFNCKTSKQCQDIVDQLEQGKAVPRELARMQKASSKEIHSEKGWPSQKKARDDQPSATDLKHPRRRLYPIFFKRR